MEATRRVVAIGDLNGAIRALRMLLQTTGLTDRNDRWCGGNAHLVQLGDIFNRGDGARESLDLLLSLQRPAANQGGQVSVLLGNHEVMTCLGNETYCTIGEYLSFASRRDRTAWPNRLQRAAERFEVGLHGGLAAFDPRLRQWMVDHVPGKSEMRRALGPRGRLGRALRRMPVVAREGTTLFIHGGVSPAWARLGMDGLNKAAGDAWASDPDTLGDLPEDSVLIDAEGPLWNRRLAKDDGALARQRVQSVLSSLGGDRMVIGHNMTEHLPGGEPGRILLRHGGALCCVDVGIHDSLEPNTWCALVIDREGGHEHRPDGRRQLW
ncbi:MAG: metallophosphoesterase [Acidobacteriota bacterium]